MPEKRCCLVAELSAFLKLAGSLELAGKQDMNLYVTTDNAGTARKVFKLFKTLFEMPVTVTMESRKRLKTKKIYTVRAHLGREHIDVLRDLGIMDTDGNLIRGVAPHMVKNRCCRRAYLRGAFLAKGSVAKPEGDYHLEIILPAHDGAKALQKMTKGCGISFRLTERKKAYVLYLKEAEQIVDFLRFIGANKALLEFENVRVIKSVKNQVNRLVNCETANLEKTLDASLRQSSLIKQLLAKVRVDEIPENMRELALLRLAYPDYSLKELGAMMSPPMSKSGVAYRMRKLEGWAETVLENRDREEIEGFCRNGSGGEKP